jgi:hypothetical protein
MHFMESECLLLCSQDSSAGCLFVLNVSNIFLLAAPAELCGVNQGKCTSALGMLSMPYTAR